MLLVARANLPTYPPTYLPTYLPTPVLVSVVRNLAQTHGAYTSFPFAGVHFVCVFTLRRHCRWWPVSRITAFFGVGSVVLVVVVVRLLHLGPNVMASEVA